MTTGTTRTTHPTSRSLHEFPTSGAKVGGAVVAGGGTGVGGIRKESSLEETTWKGRSNRGRIQIRQDGHHLVGG